MAIINQQMYEWGTPEIELLADQSLAYALRYLYVEFENVEDPDAEVAVDETIDRAAGRSYFESLSGARDYLRIPVATITKYSTDEDLFPHGNALLVVGLAENGVGVNGLPFNDTAISKIIGGAFVAAPVPADPTRDLVFRRWIYSGSDQVVKASVAPLNVNARLQFL